jgi:SAM-dependent methyltransferase
MNIQSRIENYWTGEAELFSEYILEELKGFKREAWIRLISEQAPGKEKLKVLDVGTGPGFFAIIMSKIGHDVTAIDCNENMLAYACANAQKEGLAPCFIQMDSQQLNFEDHSFDLLLCRNLTWTLTEPERAYREWYRVLKPGGRTLIFDGNWNLRLFDADLQRQHQEDFANYRTLYFEDPPGHVDRAESDRISMKLPLSKVRRPQWDLKALQDCGFSKVFCEFDITGKVWDEKETIRYKSTPMFLVAAEK